MAESIGSAYLNIVPKMDKNASSDIKSELSTVDMGGVGSSWGRSIGTKLAGAIGALEIGRVVVDVLQDAFDNYADYQQLVGGVETLFKDSADVVQEYADQAYKTAGLSANEYMETVTSFSASLLQSLGGDTAEAAKIADQAIIDMSDNANKMGTDMQLIQNAYQGFAKQNYTMLDNLKLGYGGTKKEMERLIEDANKLSGLDLSIENYDDVIQAIHIIQDELGITGTTAEEASATISGSFAALDASWQNFLTALGDPDADMDAAITNLVDSLGTAIDNAAPVIAELAFKFIGSISKGIPIALANLITEKLPEWFDEIIAAAEETLDRFWEIGYNMISGIIEGFKSRILELASVVGDATVQSYEAGMAATESASPSKKFARLGKYMIQGLTLGIEEETPNAVAAVERAVGIDSLGFSATYGTTTSVVGAINALHSDLGKIINEYSPNSIDATRSYLGELQRKAAMIA